MYFQALQSQGYNNKTLKMRHEFYNSNKSILNQSFQKPRYV